MSRSHKKEFAQLCKRDATPGYALDKSIWIKSKTITEAVEIVSEKIEDCMEKITKGWGRPIKMIYIGKSHFHKIKGRRFSPENPTTWRLGNGINQRYRDHVKKDHGRNGLIVLAVVTKKSIPLSCKCDGYITHQEEYALTLEKRLIQKFWEDPQLANRTQEPGKTDKGSSIAYVVYMTFTIDGKSQYL